LEFKEELTSHLSKRDLKLLDLFFLKYDNKNLFKQIRHPDSDLENLKGNISNDEIKALFDGETVSNVRQAGGKQIPAYFETFIHLYADAKEKEEQPAVSWEDRLATLYYDYAMKCTNPFVAAWFEFNLNINNVLTAFTCRKHDLNKADYIVGNNRVAENLRTSNARDFGIADTVDYLPVLQHIADDPNLFSREKSIDRLRWEWLEENTFFKTFDIESVLAYLIKLEIAERWANLDRVAGENAFRGLVGEMKQGSDTALEEFKRNNKKNIWLRKEL
jgi:hypothetical protein